VSGEFTLITLLSSDTRWAGTFSVDWVAWTVLAAVAGFASVGAVIPESLGAFVTLGSDNVGRAVALSGLSVTSTADATLTAVASLASLAGVKVEVSGFASVAVMPDDVVLAGTEPELVVAGLRSAACTFTRGAVSCDDGVSVETVGASFAVLATSVEHTVVAFTSVGVAGLEDNVGVQVSVAVAHLAGTTNNSRVAKVSVGALITVIAGVSHLAVAHQPAVDDLA